MTFTDLRGDTSQRVFEALMNSISEPGTIRLLPIHRLEPSVPRLAWLALALADVGVRVAANKVAEHNNEPSITRLVADATGATVTGLGSAWIVMLDQPRAHDLDELCIGTALEPELGARVAVAVEAMAATGRRGFEELTLTGPGVPGTRTIALKGVSRSALARMGRASGEFPTGFDTWFFTPNGQITCIPRSTEITFTQDRS